MEPVSIAPPAGLHKGVVYALLAAALFGASTPFAKILVGQVAPVTLAGMLYFGSGLGLLACFIVRAIFNRHAQDKPVALARPDLPWLAGAIAAGGIAGPVLLMAGLALTPASSASLLLNMEGVLTALLAWFVFKENFDRRIFFGMLLIVVAGALLSWEQMPRFGVPWGALAIVGACLCWAIDNNLTRKVSASDPLQIAGIKGLVAGLGQPGDRAGAGVCVAGSAHRGACRRGRVLRLRPQPGDVRAGAAPPRDGAHRRLFLGRAVCRRRDCAADAGRGARARRSGSPPR